LGRLVGLAGVVALSVVAGVLAAFVNFVAWPVAAGLGALSGGVGVYGVILLQRRLDRRAREAAWAAAVSDSPASPSGQDGALALLLPERRTVRFSVLHQPVLRELVQWAEGRGPLAESVVWVDGPAGCGKTRLLVEFAESVSARCGWVLAGQGKAAVAAAARLGHPGVLLVDDADTRDDVADLLTALSETGADVRVIFAARTSQWWQTVRAGLPARVLPLVPYRPQVNVPPIVGDAHSQQQMFEQALRYFTPDGAALPQVTVTPQDPPPSILLIHAAAALAAETRHRGVVDLATVVGDLFALERSRWQSTVHRAGLDNVPGATLHQALLLAALVGAVDEPAATRLLACLPTLAEQAAQDLRRLIADWLRSTYPQRFPDWLFPHLPAVLLEQHAAAAVADDPNLAAALAAATIGSEERTSRLVGLLGRALAHSPRAGAALAAIIHADPYRMTAAAITTAAAAGLSLDATIAAGLSESGDALTAEQLSQLYRLIPDRAKSHTLAITAVTLLRSYLNHNTVEPHHPDTLATRHNLANVLAEQGRYDQAAAEYRAVLTARIQMLGAQHPHTMNTRHGLANVLRQQGRYEQAAAEYQAVLTAQTETLGADHPHILATRHGLAIALGNQGRNEQAAAEYQAVLTAQTDTLGAQHPHTLATRHNLANVLADQGRYDRAAAEYRAVLTARIETLGAQHPDTLRTRHNLANVLADQGRYDRAAAECRAVLTARTKALGADHPDTLATRHNLASVLRQQGRFEQAAAEFRAVLTARTARLGTDHPHTLNTRHGLANVLMEQGRFDAAAAEYRVVLAARIQMLGAEHPDTLGTRHNLAMMLMQQGRYVQAAAEFQAVLTARTEALGAQHPDTLGTRHGLAIVLMQQGRYEQAAAEFQAVLTVQTKALGAQHPDTLRTRHNLSLLPRTTERAEPD
jgi:tetratricopeptide (TPR) repeat protein